MADYLEAYAARFDLPVRTGVRVDRLSTERDRYVVTAGENRIEADNVVPVLDDGRTLEVANVIWCTGFVPDFDWIDLLVLAEAGGPVHERGIVGSQPGLYFVGLVFQYALRLVAGRRGRQGRRAHRQADRVTPTNSRPTGQWWPERDNTLNRSAGRPGPSVTSSCRVASLQ